MWVAFLLVVAGCVCGGIVAVPVNSTWALLAWGGATDEATGQQVVDIDMFDQQSLIASLKANNQTVVCYVDVGSFEKNRPDGSDPLWRNVTIGKMNGWDEWWLDIRQLGILQKLIGHRFRLAASVGCDAIEADNTDCYDNRDCWSTMQNPSVMSGDEVRPAQLAYNRWLAQYAHSLGMSIGLKNSIDLVSDLVDAFDFAVNEECQTYNECGNYAPFIAQNKGVFGVQYESSSGICTTAESYSMMTKKCSGDGNECTSGSWKNCWS